MAPSHPVGSSRLSVRGDPLRMLATASASAPMEARLFVYWRGRGRRRRGVSSTALRSSREVSSPASATTFVSYSVVGLGREEADERCGRPAAGWAFGTSLTKLQGFGGDDLDAPRCSAAQVDSPEPAVRASSTG